MMLTRALWKALQQPPEGHPAYRLLTREDARKSGMARYRLFGLWLASIVIAPFVGIGLVSAIFLLPVVIPLAVNLRALRWATDIARVIADETQQHRYDLLAVSPLGRFGAGWVVGVACLHRRKTLQQGMALVRIALIILALGSIPSLIIALVTSNLSLFGTGILLLVSSGTLYVDAIQTVITGLLIGLISGREQNPFDAQAVTAGLLLLAQTGIYAGAGLAGLMVAMALYGDLWFGAGPLVPVLVLLLLAMALHELVIRWLWSRLTGGFVEGNRLEPALLS